MANLSQVWSEEYKNEADMVVYWVIAAVERK